MSDGYDVAQLQSLEEGWFFYDHAWTLLFEIARKVEGRSVLDVGCGTGLALSVLRALFPWRVCRGIDPSGAAAPAWRARGIDADVGSADALPYAAAAWDTTYCSHVLEHVADDAASVREILRVSRRRAIVAVPDGDVGAKNFGSPHVRVYDRKNFRKLIDGAAGPGDRVSVYSLPHVHMSNLVAIVDRCAAG